MSQVTNQVLSEQRKIISEQRQLSNQILPAVALLVQLLEESPSTQAALTSSLGNIRQLSFESGSQANNTMATADQSRVLPEVQITSKVHPQSTLRIGRSQTIRICDQFCVCKCHVKDNLALPGFSPKSLAVATSRQLAVPCLEFGVTQSHARLMLRHI